MDVSELISQIDAATERIAQSDRNVKVVMSIRSSIRNDWSDTSIQITIHMRNRSVEEWFSVLDLIKCKVPLSDRICAMVDHK